MKRIACLFLALSCGSLTLPAAAQDWTVVPLGTTNDLHVVHYAGGGHAGAGYIAGNGGFLASTPDNVTWTTENSGTSADLFSLT